MRHPDDDPTGLARPLASPPLRLAVGPVFWRVFLIAFVVSELGVWSRVRRRIPRFRRTDRLPLLLMLTPLALARSLAIAAVITFLLDLIVRWVARPIAAHWYACHGSGIENTALGFHLEPGEQVLGSAPARRRARGGWRPGTLVRTDRAVWFFPVSWDHASWRCPIEGLDVVESQPYRPLLGSFILGVPDRLIVRSRDDGAVSFAVVDPAATLAWLSTEAASGPTEPLPAVARPSNRVAWTGA